MLTLASAAPIHRSEVGKHVFLISLLVASSGTVIVYPLFGNALRSPDHDLHAVYAILAWMSTAHVALTLFFYFDADFRTHIESHKTRYLYAPFSVIALFSIASYFFCHSHWNYIYLIFQSWLIWHYTRQNIGVFSIAALSSGGTPVLPEERLLITLSGCAAILGTAHFFAKDTFLAGYVEEIGAAGKLAMIAAVSGLLAHLFSNPNLMKQGYRTAAIVSCVLFFSPTFFFDTYFPAVMSYAIAHALQYWLLMAYLAVASGRRNGIVKSIVSLSVLTVAGWAVLHYSRGGIPSDPLAKTVAGFGIGVTAAHFIIDAKAWRLKETFQRSYVASRLGPALFSRRAV